MWGYQNYLKRENSEICQEQYKYIRKREEELTKNFDLSLVEHAAYLKENLSKSGFIGFAQEVEVLSAPKNLYTSKLFDVDLELNRLRNHKDGAYLVKRDCRLEGCIDEPDNEEILQVSEQIKEAIYLLESVEKQRQIPPTPSLLKEPKSAIALLVKQIANVRESLHENQTIQNSFSALNHISCIREFIVQLEQKRQILEENYKLFKNGADEFSSLSLGTAQGLLIEYTRQRDSLQAQMRELVFLRNQISRSDFEMSSLCGVMDDGVTRDIVNRASSIALQLKDENNRSVREQERLTEMLQTQKSFLSHYLLQTCDLKRLRVKLLDDKIASLQQQTSSLLEIEKQLLKNKLEELNMNMSDLPEKWRRESLLLLKKELGAAMIEGISQLGEMKSLSQHMFQVHSRPLDQAFPPIRPQSQKMVLISFVFAVLASICCYFFIFCKALFKGLPASDENLKMSGFPVSGKLSKYCHTHLAEMQDGDLETLRRIAQFLSTTKKEMEAVVAVCIGGKYPDYSLSLAELLAMRGLRILVIQCMFDQVTRPEEIPGLWQYMHGQETDLPLRRHLTYDVLPSGGASRHGSEIIGSSKFYNLLAHVKKEYDVILIFSSADAATAEGYSMLKAADAAIITVQQENKAELAMYSDWTQLNKANSITFVYAEEFS